jgi:hypothetical protein
VKLSNGTIAIHPKIEASISGFATRSKFGENYLDIG